MQVERDAAVKAKGTGLESAWTWLKKKATESARDLTNYGNKTATAEFIGVNVAKAALEKIPFVGSALSTALGIVWNQEGMSTRAAKSNENAALTKMKAQGHISAEDLGEGYLANVFKGKADEHMKMTVNALMDLRNMMPKVQESMVSLAKVNELNCETFLNAYVVYESYNKKLRDAQEGLGWMHAWVMQTQEFLHPCESHVRSWKTSLDSAADQYFQSTAGPSGRAYHNTHCKHVVTGFFSNSIEGYCAGPR
jgi:hypothetical protein